MFYLSDETAFIEAILCTVGTGVDGYCGPLHPIPKEWMKGSFVFGNVINLRVYR